MPSSTIELKEKQVASYKLQVPIYVSLDFTHFLKTQISPHVAI